MTRTRRAITLRTREGFTILEVMVVIAIILAVVAVSIPALNAILSLDQRQAARDLALTYERLHDEAVLRNVTFRIAYHLDANYYEVEVGDPDTLIFDDPDRREAFEEELKDKLERYDPEEREAALRDEVRFETISTFHKRKVELPASTAFGGVYTPQYEDIVRPTGEEDPEDQVVVYSYLFANGFAEPTVVQLVDADDDEEGFTIVVEPLSGRVRLETEVLDQHDVFRDVPERGPDLP